MLKKIFSDWKVYVLCLLFIVIAELIGIRPVGFGLFRISFLPMLYVLVFGIILALVKVIPPSTMRAASPCIGLSASFLIAKLSTTIGPNLGVLAKSGPALILQELGNLGTIFFSIPLAVLIFKMGRQAIGAGFSNSRESSLAIVGNIYGLDSPEGEGVIGAYITGTILGTIFFSIMTSLCIAAGWFHPFSLAMAAGTGSASMMAASTAPLVEAFPDLKDQLMAYAATSNLLSSVDSLYLSLLAGIPLAKWLYKVLHGEARFRKAALQRQERAAAREAQKGGAPASPAVAGSAKSAAAPSYAEKWIGRAKMLVFSGLFGAIGSTIASTKSAHPVFFGDSVIGILFLFIPVVLGLLIDDVVRAKTKLDISSVIYVSVIGIVLSLPFFPGSTVIVSYVDKLGLLPLCTLVLAYAGVSIGKDLESFKQQGVGIVCTALMAFVGTYFGSAIIAQMVLKLTKVI
jgi:hypothetical protein